MYLERWTIDELTESTATLLRSEYRQPVELIEAEDARAAVMGRELELSSEVWSDEMDYVLSRRELANFVSDPDERGRRPELPQRHGLREGDVYWILSEEAVSPPPQSDVHPGRTEKFLNYYQERRVWVWDVTAAARQGAKVTYSQAILRAQDRERRG